MSNVLKKYLARKSTNQTMYVLTAIAMIAILATVVVSFRFNTLSGDDLVFSKQMESFGIIEKIVRTYGNWSGRIAYFIVAGVVYKIVPATILPYLSPILSLGLLVLSFYFAIIGPLYVRKTNRTTKARLGAAVLATALSLSIALFSIATYDNFYWFAGVITYVLPLVCFNFMVYIISRYAARKKGGHDGWLMVAIFTLGLFMSTLNEAFSVQLFIAVFVVLGICLLRNRRRLIKPLVVLLAAVILGLVVMKLSPGNSVRMALNQSLNPGLDSSLVGLVKMTIHTTIYNLAKILTYNIPGLVMTFFGTLTVLAWIGIKPKHQKPISNQQVFFAVAIIVIAPVVMLAAMAFAIHYGGSPDITEYTLLTSNFFMYLSTMLLAVVVYTMTASRALNNRYFILVTAAVLFWGLFRTELRAIDIVGRMVLQKAESVSTHQQIVTQKAEGATNIVLDESVEYFTYCMPTDSAETWCNQAMSYYYDVDSIVARGWRGHRQYVSVPFYNFVIGN